METLFGMGAAEKGGGGAGGRRDAAVRTALFYTSSFEQALHFLYESQ